MFNKVNYVMVNVSDMKRSVEFYRDLLGMPLKFESPGWSEFNTGDTILALHGGGQPRPQTGRGDAEQGTPAGTCSIGFNVDDVNKTFEELKAKGVHFVMPPTDQADAGIRLSVCIDPDGLPISIATALNK